MLLLQAMARLGCGSTGRFWIAAEAWCLLVSLQAASAARTRRRVHTFRRLLALSRQRGSAKSRGPMNDARVLSMAA